MMIQRQKIKIYKPKFEVASLSTLFQKCMELEDTDAQYKLEQIDRVAYIYFPSFKELDTDVTRARKNHPTAEEEKEILSLFKMLEIIWNTIYDEIVNTLEKSFPATIVIAGYYYGGVLAQLCYNLCKLRFRSIVFKIYGVGFECPRTFKYFKDSGNKNKTTNWYKFLSLYNYKSKMEGWPSGRKFTNKGSIWIMKDSVFEKKPKTAHLPENFAKSVEIFPYNNNWNVFVPKKFYYMSSSKENL